MIFKLLILLLNTGILVHSERFVVNVEKFNKRYNMFYGWDLEISNTQMWSTCYGTFIAPRVYITDPICLERVPNITDSYISKEVHGREKSKRINFNVSNIYYGEDLDETFNENKRKLAVVITNEAVEPEQDKNGYVKINSNLDDINTDQCFVPYYDGWNISFTQCEYVYVGNRYGNPANVYCLSTNNVWGYGSGLFCSLKSNLQARVLVGIVAGENDYVYSFWRDTLFYVAAVENVSGLDDVIDKKFTDVLDSGDEVEIHGLKRL
ncbi:uncharacterized protein LOC130668397 [Microplitis mediator]|uniref:uncharacterized protein LOC130668397 n=1 Tax=Microplitis mediator TaxID=375433 RepID=UPI0025528877|nr:uncharacterized protein LOC130668397 [Microplitis mediator]